MDKNDLSKSLYRAVLKALGSKDSRQSVVDRMVDDLDDENMQAQVPDEDVPVAKESVLRKDVSVSEMHQQKQAAAEAAVGMRPGQQKAMKKMNHAAMMGMGEGAKERGLDKLRKFMEKSAMKKAQKGVHTSGGFSGLEAKGQSQAGRLIERAKEKQPNEYLNRLYHERGKDMHREKLNELKQMPKPNLPKSEEMGKIAPASAPATPPMPASAKRIISKPTMPKPAQKPATMMMSEEKRILKRK